MYFGEKCVPNNMKIANALIATGKINAICTSEEIGPSPGTCEYGSRHPGWRSALAGQSTNRESKKPPMPPTNADAAGLSVDDTPTFVKNASQLAAIEIVLIAANVLLY